MGSVQYKTHVSEQSNLSLHAARAYTMGRLCLLQYDVGLSDLAHVTLMRTNAEFCRQSACVLWQEQHDMSAPPFWMKVIMTRQALLEGVRGLACARVLWLDRDAVVTEPEATFAYPAAMTVGHEAHQRCTRRGCRGSYSSTINAGIFVVQNSVVGQAIVEYWVALYGQARSRWQTNGTGSQRMWRCAGCEWAGPQYEQGAFAEKVL